ncbi:MAG: leucine-rich repeat domain-containing protein [Muribaculaceae bacterium]
MEKYFTKFRRSLRPLVYGAAALAAVAIPTVANADSYVDVDGFRYRLNINPHPGEGEYLVSAVLIEALSYDDAVRGVKLPDYVYADGVQYPVVGLDASACSGYYGIHTVGYNKFCGPRPYWESSEGKYITDVYVVDRGQFDGWTALNSVTVDYASDYTPINIGVGDVHYPNDISLSAFTTSYDFWLYGNTSSWELGRAIMKANLGFRMENAQIYWESRGDSNPSLTIKCAAPTPPEATIDPAFFTEDGTVELHVPVGMAAAYREADVWKQFGENIYEDIDYAYNHIDSYVEYDGLYYGIMYDEHSWQPYATVIGPVDRNCTSVNVAESVDWQWQDVPVKKISPCAFMDCKNITSFYLPDGLEEIGDMAFYECSGTHGSSGYPSSNKIYLPSTIKVVGDKAFYHTLVNPFMPESLKRVGNHAFSGAIEYPSYPFALDQVSLKLNDGLEYIGDWAFSDNSNYGYEAGIKSIVIPASVSHVGSYAFSYDMGGWGYSVLSEMEFCGSSLEILSDRAVHAVGNKAEIMLPSGITTISPSAVTAKSVVVGENVTKIMPYGLDAQELWMLPETPPMAYDSSFDRYSSPADKTLHVKRGCLKMYAADPVWGTFGNIVEDIDWAEVTQGDWRFKVDRFYNTAEVTGYDGDTYSVTTLVIPAEVSLDGVAYPVETLGKFAISNIRSDCSIEIPASIKRIRNYAITYSSPEKVVCKSPEPPAVDTKFPYAVRWPYNMEDMYYNAFTLCVPKGSVEAYKASDFGKMFREVVEELPTEIDGPLSDDVCGQSLPAEVYSIGGELLYKGILGDAHLPAGIYIVKQGEKAEKYIVR